MKVIIPAAGYATRLYPLTKNKPKALLKVKGRPIIEHIIQRICELPDAQEIFIVTNARFNSNFSRWLKRFASKSRLPIKVLDDGTTDNGSRLGQVGDIQFVIEKEKIRGDLLVVAGDNIFNFSLVPCARFFRKKNTIVNALWDSKSLDVAKQQGIGVVDETGKFVDFQEKSPEPKSTLTSLGIYFFPASEVRLLKRFIGEGNNADKMGYFMIWLIKNSAVYGYIYHEKWFDIGWPEALHRAEQEFAPM